MKDLINEIDELKSNLGFVEGQLTEAKTALKEAGITIKTREQKLKEQEDLLREEKLKQKDKPEQATQDSQTIEEERETYTEEQWGKHERFIKELRDQREQESEFREQDHASWMKRRGLVTSIVSNIHDLE